MIAAVRLGLLARAAGLARDTAAAALVLSATAHFGAVAWFLAERPIERSAFEAGGMTAIDVTLVEGPAEGASGEPGDNPTPAAARPEPALAEMPEQERPPEPVPPRPEDRPDRARTDAGDAEPAATDPRPLEDATVTRETAMAEAPTVEPAPVPPAKPPVLGEPETSASREAGISAEPPVRVDIAMTAGRTAQDRAPSATPPSSGGGTPSNADGASRAAAPRADNPAPSYPRAARRRGEEGRVILRVEVLPNGRAGAVAIGLSSGFGSLDKAAFDAVRRWRFHPAHRHGRPIAATVRVPVRFALNR